VLIFGYNWLHHYNPLIDWTAGHIEYFQNLSQKSPAPMSPSGPPAHTQPPEDTTTPSASPSDSPAGTPLPSVSFINAAAFVHACKLPGSESFSISLSKLESLSGCSASVSNSTNPIDLSNIPEEYHEFNDVFSQKNADTLSPHRLYNLKIELETGAEPPLGCMYSLSQSETQALREFLEENLCIGFIRPSISVHGALILFVKKEDGSL
jgi:hypothetical protein